MTEHVEEIRREIWDILQEFRHDEHGAINALMAWRDAALARVRAALRTYGAHDVECSVRSGMPCDCGLRAALEGRG